MKQNTLKKLRRGCRRGSRAGRKKVVVVRVQRLGSCWGASGEGSVGGYWSGAVQERHECIGVPSGDSNACDRMAELG